ncbi:hypothetical protein H2198_005314 [Neophaeococcomyces mojaviensis]|uniref:Uncharacterized protein n=1 Tax=Neophaeococcomyces mojaviensis TaxID=3383035 RepID=A0ACC3A681_9EURO|nr:hypothetical protein H2198_005314 [Knufia sp. JES_112]
MEKHTLSKADKKANRVLQLTGHVDLEKVALAQIQRRNWLPAPISYANRREARRWTKIESKIAHKRTDTSCRMISKPGPPGTAILATALEKCLQKNPSTGVVQKLYDDISVTANTVELRKTCDQFLLTAVKGGMVDCVSLFASASSCEGLDKALTLAVKDRNPAVVKRLLSCGANPDQIPLLDFSSLLPKHARIFKQLLRSHHSLCDTKLGPLCEAACSGNDPFVLNMLLRSSFRTGDTGTSRWDRDKLLRDLLKASKFEMLYMLTAMTVHWPLKTNGAFLDALDASQNDEQLRVSVLEILLCLLRDPRELYARMALDDVFCRCIKDGTNQALKLLVFYEAIVPPKGLKAACQEQAFEALEIVLKGKFVVEQDIWGYLDGLPTSVSKSMRQLILIRLIDGDYQIPHKNNLLLDCVKSGQVKLVERLITISCSNGEHDAHETAGEKQSFGETLGQAFWTARHLESSIRDQMMSFLLKHPDLPCSDVDGVLLDMLCDSSADFSRPLFDKIVEKLNGNRARDRSSCEVFDAHLLQSAMRSYQSLRGLRKRFEKLRLFLPTASVSLCDEFKPAEPEACQPLPTAIINKFPRKSFLDYLYNQVTEFDRFLGSEPWSTALIKILITRLPKEDELTAKYYWCIVRAALRNQSDLFHQLIQRTKLSNEVLSRLPISTMMTIPGMMKSLIDHLDRFCSTDDEFTEFLVPVFSTAWDAGFRSLVDIISHCILCRRKVRISTILHIIKPAIKKDNLGKIGELLKSAIITDEDLEALWDSLWDNSMFSTEHPIYYDCIGVQVKKLLGAGFKKSSKVEARIVDICVRSQDVSMLSVLLESWEVLKRQARPSMSKHIAWFLNRNKGAKHTSTLGEALFVSVEGQKPEMCRMLCKAGAPFVYCGISLIVHALVVGKWYSRLADDKILQILLDPLWHRGDYSNILNFTLLEATKVNRHGLVQDLLDLGASPLAYDKQCWRDASKSQNVTTLLTLIKHTLEHHQIETAFEMLLLRLKTPYAEPNFHCQALTGLLTKGIKGEDHINQSLLALCELGSFNHERFDFVDFHISHGASVDWRQGACIIATLKSSGSLVLLANLAKYSVDQSNLESLLLTACDQMHRQGIEWFMDVFRIIESSSLEPINQKSLNLVWVKLIQTCNESHVQAFIFILEKDTGGIELNGKAIFQCYSFENQQLIGLIHKKQPSKADRLSALHETLLSSIDSTISLSRRKSCLHNIINPGNRQLPLLLRNDLLTWILAVLDEPDRMFAELVSHSLNLLIQDPLFLNSVRSDHLTRDFGQVLRRVLSSDRQDVRDEFDRRINAIVHSTQTGVFRMKKVLSLTQHELDQLLVAAAKKRLSLLTHTLLQLGAHSGAVDDTGKPVLLAVALEGYEDIIEQLIACKAPVNDGSLHAAACHQHSGIMRKLLNAGHQCNHRSQFFGRETPLIAWAQHEHSVSDLAMSSETVFVLLQSLFQQMNVQESTAIVKTAVKEALTRPHAYLKLDALLINMVGLSQQIHLLVFTENSLRFSVLGMIHGWEMTQLSTEERRRLVSTYRRQKFLLLYYAMDGDQPPRAVGVPDSLLQDEQACQKRKAFNTKECSVHSELAELEIDIHASLTPECREHHGWNNDIICTECLHAHLRIRMFPTEKEDSRYKFPSTQVKCWAPECAVNLPHYSIKEYADPKDFLIYDEALTQQFLRNGKTSAKCAVSECPGACWFDDFRPTIYLCPICGVKTCLECNDLYEKHINTLCPAVQSRNKDALTMAYLEKEKKCPKCGLHYSKIDDSCNHITCGKNTHDNKLRPQGCGWEFCNLCFGKWPKEHEPGCQPWRY